MNSDKLKIYIGSFLVFIIDQISKLIIINKIDYLKEITVISNFFNITHIKNTGGAFSILNNNIYLLIIIGLLFLAFMVYYINKNNFKYELEKISISLILGGLFGNLFDRIVRNGVIDFLSFIIFKYNFPIFNIADIAIVLGVISLLIIEIGGEYYEYRHRKYKN